MGELNDGRRVAVGLPRIDQLSCQRFLQQCSRALAIPDAILTEYTLRSPIMHNVHLQPPPLAQYECAIGYEFPWGHILERRVNQYVVWDFCLSQLLMHYLRAGKRLEDCQKQVFTALERTFDCTTRDLFALVGLSKAWQLCPSSSVGMFSQVAHFTAEQQARECVVSELMAALPDIIASAQRIVAKTE
jgi:hypothetical protein